MHWAVFGSRFLEFFREHWIYITVAGVYAANVILIFTVLYLERKNKETVYNWVVFSLLFPIVSFLLYLAVAKGVAFGEKKKFHQKFGQDRKRLKAFNETVQTIDQSDPVYEKHNRLINFCARTNASACTVLNSAVLQTDANEHFEDLLREIENARQFIHLQYFKIEPCENSIRLREALVKKASENVKVRILYEGFKMFRSAKNFFKKLREAGAEIRCIGKKNLFLLPKHLKFINHRKLAVIDNKISYICGINMGKKYFSKDKKVSPWRDTQIKFTGDVSAAVNQRFISDFNFVGKSKIPENEFVNHPAENRLPVLIDCDGLDTYQKTVESAYVKLIYSAKNTIRIQTPFLIPDQLLLNALKTASKSGVEVEIMIPGIPDKKMAFHCSLFYAKELADAGCRIYLYKGFIHSKTLTVDGGVSCVSTYNLDMRCLRYNFEIAAFIFDQAFADSMNCAFLTDLENSKEYTKEDIQNRTPGQKFKQKVSRFFAPYL